MKKLLEISSLSKKFSLPQIENRLSLKKTIAKTISLRWKSLHRKSIWALNDLSFSICQGDILGIIGHNGSGKSTLLKLISGVTFPSLGVIKKYGKIGSLLEVGIGMHADLSGRDNIYFYGALLGMKRKEIAALIDKIIEFSEIQDFIDVPLKKYSSGMMIRLGCAVLFHLKADIVILDEVLSVSDFDFQKKCLKKIQELAQEGRAIVCVSHDLNWLSSWCKRGILLDKGSLIADGNFSETLKKYNEIKAT